MESNCVIINYHATFYYIYEMLLESVNCISEWKQLNDIVSHIHCLGLFFRIAEIETINILKWFAACVSSNNVFFYFKSQTFNG